MTDAVATVLPIDRSRYEQQPHPQIQRLTMVQAITSALEIEMARDESVVVLGEDVGVDGGVFRATDGLLDRFGPQRVFDTPLAESGIVGFSLGLAQAGFRPVAEIQFMGFVYPAVNQLMAHVSRYRNRTRGKRCAPLVVRMPHGGGIRALEHHSESYEVMFAGTPGLKVVIPSTPRDAKGLLASAIRDDDPVIFLEPTRLYRASREQVPEGELLVPLGQARVVRAGTEITIIAYGGMVRIAEQAAEELAKESISAEVLDLRTIMPFDKEAILNSASKTGRIIVVHEAPRSFGVGAEIAALIQERAMLELLAPIQRVTGLDTVFPYAQLEEQYLPNPRRIVAAAKEALNF